MNPYIFREYDIRGIVETDFQPNVVINLGKAYGSYVIRNGGKKVAISGDVRLTTPRLKENFIEGLLDVGIDVIDMGITHTPANYYSMFFLDIDGSVQITGSHNPSEFNGFKISFNKMAFYGEKIQYLRKIIQENDFIKGRGTVKQYDIMTPYHEMLKQKIKINKPIKIAVDCGNASGCLSVPYIFKELGIEIKELFCEIDGSFPNHHPDPTEDSNLVDLIKLIQSDDFDFGIAFDGDADRIVVVDENGSIIRSDILMSIFLPEVITEKNNVVVYDVKCSQALSDMIIEHGGKPLMWKTGHSLIKDKMKELNVLFAGEMSGHIFFADNYFGYDDAIYVALRLAQLFSNGNKKISDYIKLVPKYYSTPEMRLECENDEEKFRIVNKANEYFSKKYNCIMVDGVRIVFDDGWGLVRSSNTQPVIVCRFEAKTKERMIEIKSEVLNKLLEFGQINFES